VSLLVILRSRSDEGPLCTKNYEGARTSLPPYHFSLPRVYYSAAHTTGGVVTDKAKGAQDVAPDGQPQEERSLTLDDVFPTHFREGDARRTVQVGRVLAALGEGDHTVVIPIPRQ